MKKILLIDDDKLTQTMLSDFLSKQGWNITVASDAASASRILLGDSFSIILLDLYLPDRDGLDFLSSAKNMINSSLVIVLTASPSLDKAIEAFQSGVYDFMAKPLEEDKLMLTINKAYGYWTSKKDNAFLLESLKNKIAALEETNVQLSVERSRIYALLRDMNEGVLLMNEKGKINLINRKAMEIFKIAAGKESKLASKSIHFNDIIKKMQTVQSDSKAISHQFKEGEKRISYYNAHIMPIVQDNCNEVLAIINDITEIIKIYEMRSSFSSKISHELRTPVSAIKGVLNIIKKKHSAEYEKLKDYFPVIEKEIEQLQSEINALLEFAVYSNDNVDLMLSENDLSAIINQEINELFPQLKEKKIDVKISLPTELQAFVFDSEKIAKVIRNLLNNACKFTPEEGSIEIGSEIVNNVAELKKRYWLDENSNAKNKFIMIYIKDNGNGIETADRDNLFEPFFQAESIFDHQEGMGLGLFICKSIVKAHGGFIWMRNNQDKGSTFYFALPLIGVKESSSRNVFFKARFK